MKRVLIWEIFREQRVWLTYGMHTHKMHVFHVVLLGTRGGENVGKFYASPRGVADGGCAPVETAYRLERRHVTASVAGALYGDGNRMHRKLPLELVHGKLERLSQSCERVWEDLLKSLVPALEQPCKLTRAKNPSLFK